MAGHFGIDPSEAGAARIPGPKHFSAMRTRQWLTTSSFNAPAVFAS